MDGLNELDKKVADRFFQEEIDAARARMRMGDKSESRGRGCIWPKEIGGVACCVNFFWFARMEGIRNGRNVVAGECVVDIFIFDPRAEDAKVVEPGGDPKRCAARVDLPFVYVEDGAAGGFDHLLHFEAAYGAAKARLESAPRYLAVREAAELGACLRGAKPGRKGRL